MFNKKPLLSLSPFQLLLVEKGLLARQGQLAILFREYCYDMNTQPKATGDLLAASDEFQSAIKERDEILKLLKQIEYQKRLCKIYEQ